MPFRYIVAESTKDHPRFPHEHMNTRIAQNYTDMSDREYYQRRDEYYEFRPVANHMSWRQYLEDLAENEYGEIMGMGYENILEAETTRWSRYDRAYSPPGSRRVDRGESCTSAPLSCGDDCWHGHGCGHTEDRRHHEKDIADRFGEINIGGRPNQQGPEASEYRALVSRQPNLNDEEENACSDRHGAGASRRSSTRSDSSLPGHSEIYMGPTSSQRGPQPSSQPDQGEDRQSGGRYYAGVRALRSPNTPQPSIQAKDDQAHPSKGRYNMGVRAPQSRDGPSQQGNFRSDRALKPIDSVFSQLEEERPASGCSRHA